MRLHREITTEIHINAPAQAVWDVLTDVDSYEQWNPFFVAVDVNAGHRLEPGTGLVLHTAAHPRLRPLPARVQLREVDPPHRLEWGGGLPIPGLAAGIHRFQLTALPNGATHLCHGEHLSGALIPVTGYLQCLLRRRYDEINAALAARAEATR